eukprot:gb/GEZJ01005472.1/.p2 GENE.gb/GEZJ01005472.1/~~gb/GEZJ01005472.1/.p2  ORF type:complete len:332 (+),score=73.31 gb/GEZJ01005472.1/:1378-2373(+)
MEMMVEQNPVQEHAVPASHVSVGVHTPPRGTTTALDGVGETDGVADEDAEGEGAGELDGVGEAEAEGVADALADGDADADGAGEEEAEGTGEEDSEGAGEEDSEGAGEEDNEGAGEEDAEAAGDEDAEGIGEEEDDGTGDEDEDGAGEEDIEGAGDEDIEGAGDEDIDGAGEEEEDGAGEEDEDGPGDDDIDGAGEEDELGVGANSLRGVTQVTWVASSQSTIAPNADGAAPMGRYTVRMRLQSVISHISNPAHFKSGTITNETRAAFIGLALGGGPGAAVVAKAGSAGLRLGADAFGVSVDAMGGGKGQQRGGDEGVKNHVGNCGALCNM